MLISLLMTYLTVFVEYKMPPTPPYTAEFMPDEVLVGGLPFISLKIIKAYPLSTVYKAIRLICYSHKSMFFIGINF